MPLSPVLPRRPGRRLLPLAMALVASLLALVARADASSGSASPGPAGHAGMTWGFRSQQWVTGGGTSLPAVNVGAGEGTDAYQGDTPAATSLPILCLLRQQSSATPPTGITYDEYNGWAGGWVALTPTVPGRTLTSRQVADGRCSDAFGAGWRMAEHHDGGGNGWHLWAYGVIPKTTRFWVAIDDQPANPWS